MPKWELIGDFLKISVIIITKNEERDIAACLNSVSFANEVIIVDSGSTDATVAIAQSMGATVINRPDWIGFGAQKNRALDAATGDWVLSLDADERISEASKIEILQAINSNTAQAFYLPRSSAYCGTFLRHSGWWPDHLIRLWQRGYARFSDDIVHEKAVPTGTIGKLKNPIIHYCHNDHEEIIAKMNRYSTDNAVQAYARGKRASLFDALYHGFWGFFRTYFLQRGFLDGSAGLMYAISRAEASYYKYIKLRHLELTANKQSSITKPPTNQ